MLEIQTAFNIFCLEQRGQPNKQDGQCDGQGAADFGHGADDKADKRTDTDFACLPSVFACDKFADGRTGQRAEQQAGNGKECADDTADKRAQTAVLLAPVYFAPNAPAT